MVDRSVAPKVSMPEPVDLPALRVMTLDNGVGLRVYDRPDLELTTMFVSNCGGLAEAPDQETAIVAAEMRGYGSADFSGDEISDRLELNGALLKSAVTSHHTGSTVMSLNGKAKEVLPIAAEAILYPSFPEHETAVIANRKAEETEIKEGTEMYKVGARLDKLIMGSHHPLAAQPSAGDFRAVSRNKISEFACASLVPENMSILACGHITPAIEDAINDTFGRFKRDRKPLQPNYVEMSPEKYGYSEHIRMEKSMQTAIAVALPVIPRSHPDYLALRLAVMALGGYFGSRLQQNIREEKGLTYGISAALLGYQEGAFMQIQTNCDASYAEQVNEEIFKEIERLATVRLSEEELNRLKLAEIGTLLDVTDSPRGILNFHNTIMTGNLPADYFAQRIAAVKAINAEEIMHLASTYLRPEAAVTVSAGA